MRGDFDCESIYITYDWHSVLHMPDMLYYCDVRVFLLGFAELVDAFYSWRRHALYELLDFCQAPELILQSDMHIGHIYRKQTVLIFFESLWMACILTVSFSVETTVISHSAR